MLDRFHLREQLGAGAMGVVHRAFDPRLSRDVALKVLHGHEVVGRDRERLLREAQALARLNHPNVVQVYEVAEHEGKVFIAMEFVAGRNMREWQAAAPRGWREVVAVYLQAGAGLASAHAAGIVHRDFKPANILIGDDGRVRVADFGLARNPGQSSNSGSGPSQVLTDSRPDGDDLTESGAILGTPAYMAPEQFGGTPADQRSDQFAFCVSLWEALSEVRPYTVGELGKLVSEPATRIDPAGLARIPRRMRGALRRGAAPSHADRWPGMNELLTQLRRRAEPVRLGPRLLVAGGGLAVLGIWASMRGGEPRADPCQEVREDVAKLWSTDTRASIAATAARGPRFVADAWLATESGIAAHVSGWQTAADEVCVAVETNADPRLTCLQRTARQSRTLVEALRSGESDAFSGAHIAVAHLESPADCIDPVRLEAHPVPAGPIGLQQRVAEVRGSVDAARLAVDLGRFAEARERSSQAQSDAEVTGYGPVIAEAQWMAANVAAFAGDVVGAASLFSDALYSAQQHRHDDVVIRALTSLASLQARDLERIELSVASLRLAEATLQRTRASGVRVREYLEAELQLRIAQGEAKRAHALAIELSTRTDAEGGTDDSRAWALRQAANVLAEGGDTIAAEDGYRKVLRTRVAQLGPFHPEIAAIELDLGLLYPDDPSRARPHLERAVAIVADVFDESSVRHAPFLLALATVEVSDGKLDRARALAERAWDIQSSELPRGHSERGGALVLLADIDLAEGRDGDFVDRLTQLQREWLDTPNRRGLAEVSNRLAWHLCRLGRCSEARPHYERLRSLTEPGEQLHLYAEAGLARVELADGNRDTALRELRRLLEMVERAESGTEVPSDLLLELRLFAAFAGQSQPEGRRALLPALRAVREYWVEREDYRWALDLIDEAMRGGE